MNLATDIFTDERFGLVTGSRCSPLVPKKSAEAGQKTLAKQLAKEIVFQFYDEVSTWQMEHGQLGEQFAKEHFQNYYDSNLKNGKWYKEGEMGGSTDAEAKDYGVDFKCQTTLDGWLDNLYEPVKTEYYNQAQLYMVLSKKDGWLIANYLIETQKMTDFGLVYPIKEENRMIIQEVKKCEEWREKFFSNLPNVIAMRDNYVTVLKQKFTK